jgi:hypothetical protein
MTSATRRNVAKAIAADLAGLEEELLGVTSLAEGADQIFAFPVLAAGGQLHAVIPSRDYESSFRNDEIRGIYDSLLNLTTSQSTLDIPAPSEDAYMAAGQQVVDQSDILLAVWDGMPAGGKGGTADIVAYAQQRGIEVRVIWPSGARRR